jgi:hypothetical protein
VRIVGASAPGRRRTPPLPPPPPPARVARGPPRGARGGHGPRYPRAPSSSAARALAAAAEAERAEQRSPPPAAAAAAAPASQRLVPGAVLEISGPDEYDDVRAADPGRLVVLQCKARSCRPCKAFSRKYDAMAARFPEAALLSIYGDDTQATRQMMIRLQVRATPTFRLSRGEREVAAFTGTSDAKLRDGIVAALTEGERSAHAEDVALWQAAQVAAREAAELEAATQRMSAAASAAAAEGATSPSPPPAS